MTGPDHTVELKVWFVTSAAAERFVIRTDRSPWAGADPALEGGVRGKIVTLTGSNAEIMARVAGEYAAPLLARGFVTRIQMTGGPS